MINEHRIALHRASCSFVVALERRVPDFLTVVVVLDPKMLFLILLPPHCIALRAIIICSLRQSQPSTLCHDRLVNSTPSPPSSASLYYAHHHQSSIFVFILRRKLGKVFFHLLQLVPTVELLATDGSSIKMRCELQQYIERTLDAASATACTYEGERERASRCGGGGGGIISFRPDSFSGS